MTVWGASAALLSTIIGGGIVGIPYAMYLSGIPVGLIINVICFALSYLSTYLFMETKKKSDVPIKTLYEFGYVTIGKSSIYYIAFLSIVQTVGFVMIYFIVFGDLLGSIVLDVFYADNPADEHKFFASRICWDIILGLALLPWILKKHLYEMKLGADIHFAAVAFFIISLFIQRFTKKREYNIDAPGPYNYWEFKFGFKEITSFSILLCAYNFSFIEFPLYHSLGPDRTPKKLLDATFVALSETIVIYVSTGLLVIYLFGSGVDPNCLVNIANEGGNVLSYLNRIFFAIVIACHVPYVFFYGKEGICIVIDEI